MSKNLKKTWGSQNPSQKSSANDDEKKSIVTKPPKLAVVRTYFGVDTHNYIPSIRFECKDQTIFIMPYAHQPFIEFNPKNGIMLSTLQRVILIKGQRLKILMKFLEDNQLSWVKESDKEFDTEDTEIFIESIEIQKP